MPRHYRLADITVRIPFGTREQERIALLQAAGIPVDAGGELARGFMHEREPFRFGADSICRWFETDGTDLMPAMPPMATTTAADHSSAARAA
jgi:hypothetical protein